MKRRDLGVVALAGLAVAAGCSPQDRASTDPPSGENAVRSASSATSTTLITTMTLYDLKIGTLLGFTVYHDRSAVITVSTSDPDMTDIKTVKKHPSATRVSIKVIADGSSGLQVLSDGREFLTLIISTRNIPQA